MKKAHTITTYYMTYVRIFVLALLSVLFVTIVPLVSLLREIQEFLLNQVVNMGILYAIISGFLLSITLRRRQSLDEYISLELNKIRRIYHLSLHLKEAEPRLAKWFNSLKDALKKYQDRFRGESFSKYDEGNPLFREVTYTIYRLPSLGIIYNTELYRSLLDAAATATESREFIRSKMTNAIGFFQWLVIGMVTVTLGIILVGSTPKDLTSTLAAAAVIFNLFLVLLLLYEYDHSNSKKDQYLASVYANNLSELNNGSKMSKKG
ncbi:MAG: hypothetical protein ABII13_00420 [Patescibacteria group bacterium]|nr:hypothetical protein [Patescibacteria group bacterium]